MGSIGVLIRELRDALDDLLLHKVAQPSSDITNAPIVNAINRLLIQGGLP